MYVVGDVHTNTIEGFWSLVKRGISGVNHAVSGWLGHGRIPTTLVYLELAPEPLGSLASVPLSHTLGIEWEDTLPAVTCEH